MIIDLKPFFDRYFIKKISSKSTNSTSKTIFSCFRTNIYRKNGYCSRSIITTTQVSLFIDFYFEIFYLFAIRCQVLYDYTPQNPDELEIHVGDIINIIEMCDDGWYCGIMDKSNYKNTMAFGTFPGNYVKLLPT